MLKEKIINFDRRVPRYTSYPTAPHFAATASPKDCYQWLQDIPNSENLSLYIHIPFCSELCWYCGCNTKITRKYEPIRTYLYQYLFKEIALLSDLIGSGRVVSHIHFGGGSPGILTADDFLALMQELRKHFVILDDAEIAIEIDPRGVSADRVEAYAKAGINRVSLGVQDFNMKVMTAINRVQPYELTEKAVSIFRAAGIEQINFDLLYGLPHQTVSTILETIERAISLRPSRVAFFGYAHVPWMKKHMRLIPEELLPDTALRYDILTAGAEKLEQSGYAAIGIDHFTKHEDPMFQALQSGTLRRNFQGYTTDTSKIMLSLGVSAIGKTSSGYYQNSADMPVYKKLLDQDMLPIQKFYKMTDEDPIRGDVIERLMCHFSVDLQDIRRQFQLNEDHFDGVIQSLNLFNREGFFEVLNRNEIVVKPQAYGLIRLICSYFDEYFQQEHSQEMHSKAV